MPVRWIAWSLMACSLAVAAIAGAHDWNDAGIAWKPYTEGLAAAQKDKKPVCLVVFTEWCPHCKNYAAVFHDPKVVAAAKQFVMIHVDKEKEPAVSKQYIPDGEYFPRTFFLKADGTLDPEIKAPRDKFRYFYDEANPASLLAGMDAAQKKLQ